MTCADKIRDLHAATTPGEWDWSSDALVAVNPLDEDMVLVGGFERWQDAQAAAVTVSALPEIAAVIEAGRRLADAARDRSALMHVPPTAPAEARVWGKVICAYQDAIDAYDEAEAALARRLETQP